MRSTCFGARSGRNSITTLPLVVSSVSFSLSAMMLNFLDAAIVDETQREGTPGERIAERGGEGERRAARQRVGHGALIDGPGICGNPRRHRSEARLAQDFAAAIEGKEHGHFHAGTRVAVGGRPPAG